MKAEGKFAGARKDDEFKDVPERRSHLMRCLNAQQERDQDSALQSVSQQEPDVVQENEPLQSEPALSVDKPLSIEELELCQWAQVYGDVLQYDSAVCFVRLCQEQPRLQKAHPALYVQARLVIERVEMVSKRQQERRNMLLGVTLVPLAALGSWLLGHLKRVRLPSIRGNILALDAASAMDVAASVRRQEPVVGDSVVAPAPASESSIAASVSPAAEQAEVSMAEQADILDFEDAAKPQQKHGKRARTLRREKERLARSQGAA